jgi:hypothetical protein
VIIVLLQIGLIWIWLFWHCLHEDNKFAGGLHFDLFISTHGLIPFANMEGFGDSKPMTYVKLFILHFNF